MVGEIRNFVIITDNIVENLYAQNIVTLLTSKNYKCDLFVFEAGENSKTRRTKEIIEDAMLQKGIGSVMEFEGGKYATVISEEEIRRVIEDM